jgi:MarR family
MREVQELRYLILALQREGHRLFAARLRPLGLTPAQAETLTMLAVRQPLTLGGLGDLLVCDSGASPSRLVERLVAAGLVRREAEAADRRQILLSLTRRAPVSPSGSPPWNTNSKETDQAAGGRAEGPGPQGAAVVGRPLPRGPRIEPSSRADRLPRSGVEVRRYVTGTGARPRCPGSSCRSGPGWRGTPVGLPALAGSDRPAGSTRNVRRPA